MQNQNMQSWTWGQTGAPPFPTGPVFPSTFSPAAMDQNQLMSGYQQMYGAAPSQPPPDYSSQWSAAQIQHWQQWQQWQEKYQQWQAQYGKKYAESIAAMGQNPNMVLPSLPAVTGMVKPNEGIPNPGYTTVNPPPPPSNAQPVPPPPPEEDKPATATVKDKNGNKSNEAESSKESVEELSEAERTFDIQFKQWEDQFNEWKKQNQDHPDKAQYREYEKKWETWREQLLQRREQMRKKRLSKSAEASTEINTQVKNEETVPKPDQDQSSTQGKGEQNYRSVENPAPEVNSESKPMASLGVQDVQGITPHKQQEGNPPGNYWGFPDRNIPDSRVPGYPDRENPNFGVQGQQSFGPGGFDRGREKDLLGGGPRFDNANFPQRRSFGNGTFEEDRKFTSRYGNFENRPPGQDRFLDNRLKDGKFGNTGREFGPPMNEQVFGRSFQDRNFESKPPFVQNNPKSIPNNTFSKPKVPSLFDITVEKPPGLRSPGRDRKPKIWEEEKDKYLDGPKDEKNVQRNENPWIPNAAWANNSPWIKPWELDRVVVEKPPDANLRPDAWQKESLLGNRSDEKLWSSEMRKSDMDKSELSGYVGKILAKLGNFNVLPPKEQSFMVDNTPKMDDNVDNKFQPFIQGQGWKIDVPNPNIFSQDGPKDGRPDDLFGRGDCDDRVRFDRDRPNFGRDNRNFGGNDFRRDDRGFPDQPTSRSEDDRFFSKGDRNTFGREGGKFPPVDDIDERVLRNRDRNGRRGFDDREDRGYRGLYDRDDRRNRSFGSPYDRFGRNTDTGAKESEWNPQIFDYSKSNQPSFRNRFSDTEDNFHISTVVDYSHGENKQTFDYAHGEAKSDNFPVKSFDYGHGTDTPAVIDYGHGGDRDAGLQQWKKESQDKTNENTRSRSKSMSPHRPRSPRSRPRSRSRSPHSRARRESNSPSFRGQRSRSRDRFNRQPMKRNRRNNSEEKAGQAADGEISKNNFDVTTVLVEDLICSPGRESRPNKLVFIMRGLPGSGKTYVTKLIKDKEVELGGDAPRILSLDDYFMTEVEKEVVDEESGRKIKKKILEYEYESCAEPHYRGSLLKAFKKTISDGFFSFIIVDSVNEKTKDYEEMWSFAKQKGFQVYVAEMDDDVAICTKRNIHKRTEKEISDLAKAWEKTPNHYLRLDVRSLLQADAITEVEMEVVSDVDLDKDTEGGKEVKEEENKEDEEEDEPGESAFVKSRWDHFENSEQKLDRLDGLKRRREGHTTMQDYLQLPDDFDIGSSEPTDGKKKVRWADLEERRQQEKMRAIGFVVGQTDWSRMTDPTFGESALTRTKYI